MASDVHPVTVIGEAKKLFSIFNQEINEIWEVKIVTFSNVIKYSRIEGIDSHTHLVIQTRLFIVSYNLIAMIRFYNPVLHFNFL